ncbi:MAG: TerB family tellurite resistance protein [Oligoflexia bacterium]|nr:TerB family tellurite resistance protein [Oligoflexia bacterium]
MLPDDWKPIDSLAVLLLSVAAADGDADRTELDTITARLCALAPKSHDRVDEAVHRALDHWFLQIVPGVDLDPGDWVAHHCKILSDRYGPKVLHRFVVDMVAVAKASGGAQAAEIQLTAGIASAWGLDPMAARMVTQFNRAQQRKA